jgi:hypothetical protein
MSKHPKSYECRTLVQLHKIAKQRHIKQYSKLKKQDLINKLRHKGVKKAIPRAPMPRAFVPFITRVTPAFKTPPVAERKPSSDTRLSMYKTPLRDLRRSNIRYTDTGPGAPTQLKLKPRNIRFQEFSDEDIPPMPNYPPPLPPQFDISRQFGPSDFSREPWTQSLEKLKRRAYKSPPQRPPRPKSMQKPRVPPRPKSQARPRTPPQSPMRLRSPGKWFSKIMASMRKKRQ